MNSMHFQLMQRNFMMKRQCMNAEIQVKERLLKQ